MAVPADRELLARRRLRLTSTELGRSEGVDAEVVQPLVAYGLITTDDDGFFGADDLEVARAASALVGHGIEVRHLRPFRTAAEREVALAEHAVAPLRPTRPARTSRTRGAADDGSAGTRGEGDEGVDGTDAARVAAEVARSCLALHTALVRDGLRRLVGSDGA